MQRSKPSRIALVIAVALAGVLDVAAAPADTPPAAPAGAAPGAGAECKADADCVPAGCCHATSCVPVAEAPDCKEVACTAECRPGTLDCGGRCVCTADGQCTAKLKDEPSP